ncbi:5919_t:CDS:2 [Funneliformis geosporum]|uniref:2392_t:CDS:1 n=1 Tax=Funneliformis geosporum TaxID=1117311 RepID=A0A9W4SG11_9GLOM|nr:2392_t:CDS:2 [Funneliformis geosporum]CAI2168545.1 5919_t:CDS:2 [Funneliformis geosporum]
MVQKSCFCWNPKKKGKGREYILQPPSNGISLQVTDENLVKDDDSNSTHVLQSSIPIKITTPNNEVTTPSLDPKDSNSKIKKINVNSLHPFESNKKELTMQATKKVFTMTLEAAEPFFPWIKAVNMIINEIVNLYENVEYNKKTCLVLVERVELIGLSVKTLTRRMEENCEKFREETYFHSFIKLHKILNVVKSFIEDASQLKGYKKFLHASDVKDRANSLLTRLESSCNDLQFSIIISQETKIREQQSLSEDVTKMIKFLKSLETEGEKTITAVNRVYEEVLAIYKRMSDSANEEKKLPPSNPQIIFNAPTINPKDLDAEGIETSHENIIRRRLRKAIPVACKILNVADNNLSETKRIQAQLAILNCLQSSNKIIKFHGKSVIDDYTVLVFDWAEHGNLKNLYEQGPLNWVDKLNIAHDISNGLVFLQACMIFHHDLRCENILITGDARYEAKIANFHLSREHHDLTIQIKTYSTIIRWLAPEKMPKDNQPSKEKYNFKCEIFSFGMLLWELGAQMLPYKSMEMKDIIAHVMNKRRETFEAFDHDHRNDKSPIFRGFMRIIKGAWAHEREQRLTINDIYQELDDLVGIHSCRILPKRSSSDMSHSDQNNSKSKASSVCEFEDEMFALEPILSLDEAINTHKRGDKEKAWKCFEIHATIGDPIAIYWKAYYYSQGYVVEKNIGEAFKLYKKAADSNVPEAQFHYANALLSMKKPEFLNYLIKAADNGYSMAQYTLGNLYLNGREGIEINREKGLRYLESAALQNNSDAIKDLKKLNPGLLVTD